LVRITSFDENSNALNDGSKVRVHGVTVPKHARLSSSSFNKRSSKALDLGQMEKVKIESGSFDSRSNSSSNGAMKADTPRALWMDGAPRRVLLVEDSHILQQMVRMMLQKLDCETDVAANGQEGLEMLKTRWYHMVLCDINMPVMNGLEMVKEFRAWEGPIDLSTARCNGSGRVRQFIWGLSANADTGDRRLGISAGMDGYLTKPVNLSTLEYAVRFTGSTSKRLSETIERRIEEEGG